MQTTLLAVSALPSRIDRRAADKKMVHNLSDQTFPFISSRILENLSPIAGSGINSIRESGRENTLTSDLQRTFQLFRIPSSSVTVYVVVWKTRKLSVLCCLRRRQKDRFHALMLINQSSCGDVEAC